MSKASLIATSLALLTGLVIGFAQETGGAEKSSPPTVGIYTAEQAERGQQAFFQHCASCHGIRLNGGMGPALTGASFNTAWGARTVRALYDFASENMPLGLEGTLSDQTYADIIAFILSNNGHPAGDTELTPETEAMETTRVDPEAE